jgi:hypothetical protein
MGAVRAVWCALPMLPAPLQFIIAMLAYASNERMARKVEYLREEVLVLKERPLRRRPARPGST